MSDFNFYPPPKKLSQTSEINSHLKVLVVTSENYQTNSELNQADNFSHNEAKINLMSHTQTTARPNWMGLILLSTAILILSSASILIRLSENELGPFATIFNRLWIAIIALVVWKTLTKARSQIIEGVSIG